MLKSRQTEEPNNAFCVLPSSSSIHPSSFIVTLLLLKFYSLACNIPLTVFLVAFGGFAPILAAPLAS